MTELSPTDNGSVQDSSDNRNDESLLDNGTNQTADEQQQDTGSDDNSSESDSGSSSNQNDDDQSSDDDGLSKFAKSQGFDPENMSEDVRKALKIAHDNQKAYRKTSQQKSEELRKATDEINDPNQVDEDQSLSSDERRDARRDYEIAQLRAAQQTRDFYADNPEARDYDKEMAQVIVNEKEQYGIEAARLLARNLPRVLREAKELRGDNDSAAAREAGRREERELLRKRQEGSADNSHSTQTTTPGKKVTREWLSTQYDSSNPEHVKMVDEALARGDL